MPGLGVFSNCESSPCISDESLAHIFGGLDHDSTMVPRLVSARQDVE
jgi:hypothetical protein